MIPQLDYGLYLCTAHASFPAWQGRQ